MTILFIKRAGRFVLGSFFAVLLVAGAAAQKSTDAPSAGGKPSGATAKLAKITQIDEIALKKLLKTDGKPLLVNFWATWCDPCRDEFPDLVRIDADYKGRIDFITVSLDDLAEIDRGVPKFLFEMNAEMPAFLLKSTDENAAIAAVSTDWKGGLPFSILIGTDGKTVYTKQGKISPPSLRLYLDRALAASQTVE